MPISASKKLVHYKKKVKYDQNPKWIRLPNGTAIKKISIGDISEWRKSEKPSNMNWTKKSHKGNNDTDDDIEMT